jgi:hypothetical protein
MYTSPSVGAAKACTDPRQSQRTLKRPFEVCLVLLFPGSRSRLLSADLDKDFVEVFPCKDCGKMHFSLLKLCKRIKCLLALHMLT